MLKGGPEASNTNRVLYKLVQESLEKFNLPKQTITLVNSNEEINDLLEFDSKYIDLILPIGPNSLIQTIQNKKKSIPVLGKVDGVCHVYIDKEADLETAVKIGKHFFWKGLYHINIYTCENPVPGKLNETEPDIWYFRDFLNFFLSLKNCI